MSFCCGNGVLIFYLLSSLAQRLRRDQEIPPAQSVPVGPMMVHNCLDDWICIGWFWQWQWFGLMIYLQSSCCTFRLYWPSNTWKVALVATSSRTSSNDERKILVMTWTKRNFLCESMMITITKHSTFKCHLHGGTQNAPGQTALDVQPNILLLLSCWRDDETMMNDGNNCFWEEGCNKWRYR
jgi:hypothetical protein